jgi:hypothetical protein
MKQKLTFKITARLFLALEKTNTIARARIMYKLSRLEAINKIERVRKENNRVVVDAALKRRIKDYCKTNFGSENYWPWIALYTEIRGEFIEGWVPDDYYRFELLKKWNYNSLYKLSALRSYDHKLFPDTAVHPIIIKAGRTLYDVNLKQVSVSEAMNILATVNKEVVIKEVSGSGGTGISFLDSNRVDEKLLSQNVDYIIQPALAQEPGLEKLNKNSLNTFRVYSYIDENGKCTVRKLFVKMGKEGSRVDNIAMGGNYIPVDGQGFLEEYSYNGMGIKKKHGKEIYPSNQLPYYDRLIEVCVDAHKKFPFVRFVGWDVAINSDAEPVIIEWNSGHPLFWVYEATSGPFWDQVPGTEYVKHNN